MLGYILGLLKGFKYLRKTGDLIGDNLILRLLRRSLVLDAQCKSTEYAENKLRGLILTVINKVRKLWVEVGILTEDPACNLRGDIVIFYSVCNSHILVYGGDTVEKRVNFITVN